MQLEELKPGLRVEGLIPAEVITVIATQWHSTDALELTYKNSKGALGQQVVFCKDQDALTAAQTGSRAFDRDCERLQAGRRGSADHIGRAVRPDVGHGDE